MTFLKPQFVGHLFCNTRPSFQWSFILLNQLISSPRKPAAVGISGIQKNISVGIGLLLCWRLSIRPFKWQFFQRIKLHSNMLVAMTFLNLFVYWSSKNPNFSVKKSFIYRNLMIILLVSQNPCLCTIITSSSSLLASDKDARLATRNQDQVGKCDQVKVKQIGRFMFGASTKIKRIQASWTRWQWSMIDVEMINVFGNFEEKQIQRIKKIEETRSQANETMKKHKVLMESNKMKRKTQSPCKCQSRWFLPRHWDANEPFEIWTVFGCEKHNKNICQENQLQESSRLPKGHEQILMLPIEKSWSPKSNKAPLKYGWWKKSCPLGMPQTVLIVGPNQHLGHPKCRIFVHQHYLEAAQSLPRTYLFCGNGVTRMETEQWEWQNILEKKTSIVIH